MRTAKLKTIKCPKCGREYLPAEIFYPKYFFGDVKNIVKDENGQILSFQGDSLNTTETYICDNCNTALKVIAHVSFDAVIDTLVDFDNDFIAPVETKFELKEN